MPIWIAATGAGIVDAIATVDAVIAAGNATTDSIQKVRARRSGRQCLKLKFSAPPLRTLRLCGEYIFASIHPGDAKAAETTQKKLKLGPRSEHGDWPVLTLSFSFHL